MNPMTSKHESFSSIRSELRTGLRDVTPLIIGAIPFGIIFGTISVGTELTFAGAMAMSLFVFAGSAQFIALGLLISGTTWPIIILTTFIVNLRHLLYSTTLVPHVKGLSHYWRAILAFGLTDEAFAVVSVRYQKTDSSPHKHWYYLASAFFMYSNWQLCTYLGLTIGNLFPGISQWGLDFAMSVTFIGMVIPYLKNRPMWAAVFISGVVAVIAYPLPHKMGLILAAFAGIACGVMTELLMIQEPE